MSGVSGCQHLDTPAGALSESGSFPTGRTVPFPVSTPPSIRVIQPYPVDRMTHTQLMLLHVSTTTGNKCHTAHI